MPDTLTIALTNKIDELSDKVKAAVPGVALGYIKPNDANMLMPVLTPDIIREADIRNLAIKFHHLLISIQKACDIIDHVQSRIAAGAKEDEASIRANAYARGGYDKRNFFAAMFRWIIDNVDDILRQTDNYDINVLTYLNKILLQPRSLIVDMVNSIIRDADELRSVGGDQRDVNEYLGSGGDNYITRMNAMGVNLEDRNDPRSIASLISEDIRTNNGFLFKEDIKSEIESEIELRKLDEGLLNETQRIQIKISEIAKSIEKDNYDSLREIIYRTITIRPDFKQELDRVYGANPEIRKLYDKKLVSHPDAQSMKWVSWIINPGSGKFKGDNYKLYYSLKPDDITVFVQSFFKLVEMLRAATKNSKDNIKIKIPDNSTVFIAENDNIVIHFKDKTAKDEYDAVVKTWASQYRITLGQRTHSFGQDTKDNSYGQLLAGVFVKFAKDLKTQGYTPEQIAQWIGQNFTTIISRVKIQ